MPKLSARVKTQVVSLAWDCWSMLGVSSWSQGEIKRVIDPEGLVLLTGGLGNADPRLRQESQDWCLHYPWLLSRARLRTLRKSWPASESWGHYAGALQASLGQPWPGAVVSEGVQETGKSTLRLGNQPALLSLQLRAVFGVGARTEILRVLLENKRPLTAAELARQAAYAKRSIAESLLGMTASGVVSTYPEGRRMRYALKNPQALAGLFGGMEVGRKSMLPYFKALARLTHELGRVEDAPPELRSLEARPLLTALVNDLGDAAVGWIEIPAAGEDAWQLLHAALHRWLQL
jgi:DNA-binding transcriptional ArsR family regulator